eukprot:1152962-Pelagomonas_calceolata.AAC.6
MLGLLADPSTAHSFHGHAEHNHPSPYPPYATAHTMSQCYIHMTATHAQPMKGCYSFHRLLANLHTTMPEFMHGGALSMQCEAASTCADGGKVKVANTSISQVVGTPWNRAVPVLRSVAAASAAAAAPFCSADARRPCPSAAAAVAAVASVLLRHRPWLLLLAPSELSVIRERTRQQHKRKQA